MNLDRDLEALANWGLLEVGEMDGERAYRVSPLVEPKLDVPDATRWHEAAAEAWERLAVKVASGAARLERIQAAWEHALWAGHIERADRLARRIHTALNDSGLYADNLRFAERHLEALPQSPFGNEWAGFAEYTAGRPGQRATARMLRGHALLVGVVGTEEHSSVANLLHHLGRVLHAQGDLVGARKALERALAIQTKVFGTEEHPHVAASLTELGGVLQTQGDLTGAHKAIERALAIRVKFFGEEAPEVAAPLHALARVLRNQGDLVGARKAIERSLAIQTKVFGTEEHPHVAASLHMLSGLLEAQGDLAGARKVSERALAIKAKVHGTEEHPSVAESLLV